MLKEIAIGIIITIVGVVIALVIYNYAISDWVESTKIAKITT